MAYPGMFISNWDSFGSLSQYDFGTRNGGAPVALRLPPIGLDGLGYVLPSEGGVEFVVSLSAGDLARFKQDNELLDVAGGVSLGDCCY